MDIGFAKKKTGRIFNSERLLVKAYGARQAEEIQDRYFVLRAAPTLAGVPTKPPERRHELKGQRKGEFAVDLVGPFRLIFKPNHDPVPRKEDGGIDVARVTSITILGVEDYHGK